MLVFKSLRGKDSIKGVKELGFEENELVVILFANGGIKCGRLQFVTEYSTMFDVNIVVDSGYNHNSIDIVGALGICKVVLE